MVGSVIMVHAETPPPERGARILNFRRGRAGPPRAPAIAQPPVEDLTKYEHDGGADDYRHRMMMNAAAFVFVAALIAAGLWLADTMAEMRKNQDCVLSGRRNCAPIEINKDHW
ncbi:MAG TPA: hypothetical protein VHV58_06925 [Pseudolabrys sp.]|nr:hypothetical protein [Pseudolabrys sp.]